MKTSYEMLIEIKNIPNLYLNEKSFSKLMIYIDGYTKCLTELFAEYQKGVFSNFTEYVNKYFKVDMPNHNWKDIILFENQMNEQLAFDEFYKILEKYLNDHPTIMKQEINRQAQFHKLQLKNNLEKIAPTNDYLTSGTIDEYLKLKKK